MLVASQIQERCGITACMFDSCCYSILLLPCLPLCWLLCWLLLSLIQRGKYAEGWAALREVRGPFYDPYPEYQAIVAASAAMPHVSKCFKARGAAV